MEIYIPVLQNSKKVTASRKQNKASLVITEDTGHATTQARIISIASKSVGFRTHITLHTFMDLPGDEDSMKQELNKAMERDVIFLSPAVSDLTPNAVVWGRKQCEHRSLKVSCLVTYYI